MDAQLDQLRTEKNTKGDLLVPQGVSDKVAPMVASGAKSFQDFKAELLERLGKEELPGPPTV